MAHGKPSVTTKFHPFITTWLSNTFMYNFFILLPNLLFFQISPTVFYVWECFAINTQKVLPGIDSLIPKHILNNFKIL